MERVFLGWDRPVLAVAVEYVLDRFGGTAGLDLSNLLIAVPGGRAGRRLEELLLEKAEARDPAWIPPRILTLGRLPETLYRLKQPLADDLVQPLAWSWAIDRLRASAPEALEHLLPHPPDNDDFAAREAIGKMLAQLHRELAADGLDFRDVVRHCRSLENAEECRRWETLAQLQEGYLEKLDSLKLWDLQTARLYAIEHRECRTEKEILLVGTVDMNRTQRRMLDQVSDRVTSLVFAPEAMSEEFDAHGCVRPKRWREREIPIDDAIIEVVDHPADQATAVVRWLADLDGKYSASEISLGVPSEKIVPFLHQQLSGCGIDARYGPACR